MKIVMLIDTLSYRGGAERQFAGLAIALHKNGIPLKVIAYHNHDGYQSELNEEGVPYIIVDNNITGRFQKLLAIKKQIDIEKPDIVISYKGGPNNICCILKILGAKWKLVVSDRNTLKVVNKQIKIIYQFLYKYADAIVTNSYSQKDFIIKHFSYLKKKITVITNFTDIDKFHPSDNKDNENNKKTILTVARIAEQKNVLNFIEAVRILESKWKENINFVWYGAPNINEEEYYAQCKAKINEYNLNKIFRFEQPVKNIEKIYREVDFFCLPSLWEGFPNALCEAMASGLPVAASRICDNENIIDNDKNGLLFDPNNSNNIAKAINDLLNLPAAIIKDSSIRARQYAINNLSINAFANKYLNLIKSIME